MRKLLLSLMLLAFAAPAGAQNRPDNNPFGRENFPIEIEGSRPFTPSQNPITEIEAVKSTPLFANLPFLRLRTGDEFVIAQVVSERGKGQGTRREINFFLRRGGKYQAVSVDENRGERRLKQWTDVGLFDWEPTRDNADKLWEWSRGRNDHLTIENLRAVEAALLPDFAEALSKDWQRFTDYDRWESGGFGERPTAPAPVPQPGYVGTTTYTDKSLGFTYRFTGLSYDPLGAQFSAFEMQFSAAGIVRFSKPILVGPPYVSDSEIPRPQIASEGVFAGGMNRGGNNRGGGTPVTPRTVLRLRAQKARHDKFRGLVFKALGPDSEARFY